MKPLDAERLAELMLRDMGCTSIRRSVRTRFHKVDFFGADIVGKLADGTTYYCQVTTGGREAQRRRMRKLEAIPWSSTDVVLLAVAPTSGRVRELRVRRLVDAVKSQWTDDEPWEAPPKWRDVLRKLRKETRDKQGTDDHPVTD